MKKLPFVLLLPTFLAFAHSEPSQNSNPNEDPTVNFPQAGEGTKIVPLSQMNLPESVKKGALSDLQQFKTKGFIESNSSYPNQLLYMGNGGKIATMDATGVDPYDAKHLKKNLSQIRLAFPFNGIPFVDQKDIIGFSVLGGLKGTGWSGISELFNYKDVGTCQFNLINMSYDGGTSEQIMAESVRYDVNKKPTTLSVQGSKKQSAFLYTIRWSDKMNYYDLECANKTLNQAITKNLIKLAQDIDKALNPNS